MKLSKIMLSIVAVGALASCNGNTFVLNNETLLKQPANKVFAYQAATSLGMVNEIANLGSVVSTLDGQTNDDLVEEIKKYLGSVETALMADTFMPSLTETTSDLEGYEKKMEVSYTDLNSSTQSFVMYYNEVSLNDQINKQFRDDDRDDYDDKDDDDRDEHDDHDYGDRFDQEEEFLLSGIIISGDNRYDVTGKKEIENDEIEYSFKFSVSENTYILVEQETENSSQEFSYKIYESGREIYEYELGLDRGNVEIEIEDKDGTNLEIEFKFITRDGQELIKAEYEKNNREIEILFRKVINETDGSYYYEVVK